MRTSVGAGVTSPGSSDYPAECVHGITEAEAFARTLAN